MKRIISIILITCLAICIFAGCKAKSAADVQKKLTAAEYVVYIDNSDTPAMIEIKTGYLPTSYLEAKNGSEMIYAIYFKSNNDAKGALSFIETWAQNKINGAIVKIKGNCIYFGTEQGIKTFEK